MVADGGPRRAISAASTASSSPGSSRARPGDPLARRQARDRDPPRSAGQVSYFIALHEIGHLVGPGRSAPRLEAEANAWLWALAHSAVEPTPATRRSIARRLRGYLEWAQNRQYRRVPPRIPPREHAFWDLLALG